MKTDTTVIDAMYEDVVTVESDIGGGVFIAFKEQAETGSVFLDADGALELYNAIGDRLGLGPARSPVPQNGKWEEVTVDPKGAGHTYRLRIPGGHLYRTVSYEDYGNAVAAQSTVFVPASEISNDVDYPGAVEV